MEIKDRTTEFGDRVLDVVEALERKRIYRRIVDQMVGSGTSVAANACEADQAVSRPDFCKALGTVVKELAERSTGLGSAPAEAGSRPADWNCSSRRPSNLARSSAR